MTITYDKSIPVVLGQSSGWSEEFVQDVIAKDPSVLGLGELGVRDKERRQSIGGRLDFLLEDSAGDTRYVVEVQIHATDPSHIIRTIEYWDIERRKYPDYEHIAVLVAGEITSRYFNVISLFNQHIPMIAIKVSGMTLGDKSTLVFTKILDYSRPSTEDEDVEYQETNHAYWEERTSVATMQSVDALLLLAKEVSSSIQPKYNKGSIPLKVGLSRSRLLTLRPKKKLLQLSLPIDHSLEIEAMLDNAAVSYSDYDERRGRYSIIVTPEDVKKSKAVLKELFTRVYRQSLSRPQADSENEADAE